MVETAATASSAPRRDRARGRVGDVLARRPGGDRHLATHRPRAAVEPADLVPRIAPRPLLLVYAGRGGGGEELNPDYYRAASAPKTLWKIPEAGHVGGLQARPRECEQRVTRFFDRALLGRT